MTTRVRSAPSTARRSNGSAAGTSLPPPPPGAASCRVLAAAHLFAGILVVLSLVTITSLAVGWERWEGLQGVQRVAVDLFSNGSMSATVLGNVNGLEIPKARLNLD